MSTLTAYRVIASSHRSMDRPCLVSIELANLLVVSGPQFGEGDKVGAC